MSTLMRLFLSLTMNNITDRVFRYIEENDMVHVGDQVVVGVSGGADSLCLLFLLWKYQRFLCGKNNDRKSFALKVIHIHHGIRGESADGDAVFVENFCRERHIECITIRKNIPEIAKQRHETVEEAGRRERYSSFMSALDGEGRKVIAVAHHMDDQAETVVHNLLRGTGIRGLCGMRAVDSYEEALLIRPLLCFRRSEIEDFLSQEGLSFRTDETNADTDYSRNRIRHNIIPECSHVNQRSTEHIGEAADRLSRVWDFLIMSAGECYNKYVTDNGAAGEERELRIDGSIFSNEHIAVVEEVLRLTVKNMTGKLKDITAEHLSAIERLYMGQSGKSIDLPYRLKITKNYEEVIFTMREDTHERVRELKNAGKNPEKALNGWRLKTWVFDLEPGKELDYPKDFYTKWFDYDKIKGNVVLRGRGPGDRITLNVGTQKLQDFFTNQKIPANKRDDYMIVSLKSGSDVIWVVGDDISRISENYKVTPETKKVLEAKLVKDDLQGEKKMNVNIRTMITEEQVDTRIAEIAAQISEDYAGQEVTLVCILKGSVFYTCELAKRITVPVRVEFMRCSSYGNSTNSSGEVKVTLDMDEPLEGKNIIVVEDIIDTGRTLSYLLTLLKTRNPASLKLTTLLDKPDRRVVHVDVDYVGFVIPDEFVVGYGLDYAQDYRNLPYIGVVE